MIAARSIQRLKARSTLRSEAHAFLSWRSRQDHFPQCRGRRPDQPLKLALDCRRSSTEGATAASSAACIALGMEATDR